MWKAVFSMDNQTKAAKEATRKLRGRERIKNFWYYYKWHVIISTVAAITFIFLLCECMLKVHYDLNISLYSTVMVSDLQTDSLTEEFSKHISDITGNGKNEVEITYNFANFDVPSEQNQAVVLKLTAELAGGNSFGYIFDEEFLNYLSEKNPECIENAILISDVPLIKNALEIKDGQKFYWVTKPLYEAEVNKPKKVAMHKNAVEIAKYLSSF